MSRKVSTMSHPSHGSAGGGQDYVRISPDGPPISINSVHDTASIPRIRKVCCVCGENLEGKPRMKDSSGRYWCYECGIADQQKKHMSTAGTTAMGAMVKPICAECNQAFKAEELLEYAGRQLCAECINKIERAAQREASRLAAAEQEALRMARNHRILMTVIAIVAIGAIAFAIWRLVRM